MQSSNYEYSPVRLILVNCDDFTNKACDYIIGKNGKRRDLYIDSNLKKGVYYLFIDIEWHSPKQAQSFALTSYGPSVLKFIQNEKLHGADKGTVLR